jgi:hypothetical protein
MFNDFLFPQVGLRDSDTDIILFQEEGEVHVRCMTCPKVADEGQPQAMEGTCKCIE